MPDALALLADDHRKVLELLTELTGGAGGPSRRGRGLEALAEQVAIAESEHEAIEELCLWPLVRARLELGDQLAREAIEQEEQGKELIQDLERLPAGSEQLTALARRLESTVRDRISYEENQVWPKLRLALSDGELADLGDRLTAARLAASTRPHRRTPADPRLLDSVGPAVGVLDQARDALSGRGRARQGRWRLPLIAAGVGVAAATAVWLLIRSGATAGEQAVRRGARRGDPTGRVRRAALQALGTRAALAALTKGSRRHAGALAKGAGHSAGALAKGAGHSAGALAKGAGHRAGALAKGAGGVAQRARRVVGSGKAGDAAVDD